MGTNRLPAAKRRQQLAYVAIETFARKGFDATSMDEIAEAAGVTKPVLYQHFKSKRALFLELLDYVGGELLEAIAKATATAAGPRQQVECGFSAYFRFVDQHASAFRMMFASGAQGDSEFAAEVRRVESTIAHAVASMIDADIDPAHREVLGRAVVGLAEGTSRYWLGLMSSGPEETAAEALPVGDDGAWMKDPEQLARRIADLAWAGLRAVHRD